MPEKRSCYNCLYKENVPGNAHIKCNNPDPDMTAEGHGIVNGWFHYPYLFDPVWMTKECDNFKAKVC